MGRTGLSDTEERLVKALDEAKATIQEQQAILEKLSKAPFIRGTVVLMDEVDGEKTAVVLSSNGLVELPVAKEFSNLKEMVPGCTVRLHPVKMIIVGVVKGPSIGGVATVAKSMDDGTCEIEGGGMGDRVVYNGKLKKKDLKAGDKVLLDMSGMVILQNLGPDKARFNLNEKVDVSWADIGGLRDAKKQMVEAIEWPHRYAKLYKGYGKKPVKGVLLYGPPGCGKTMLGKAAATSIAKTAGKEEAGFLYVKGPEILNKYVGESEAIIRSLFHRAREYKLKHGAACVIFIDEADAVLGKRGMGKSSDMERTIVPQFLAEMDGLEDSGSLMILATNRADVLDPAVVRDGRVDRKIMVGRPSKDDSIEIFERHLSGVPGVNGNSKELATKSAEVLHHERWTLCMLKTKCGELLRFTLGHVCNGAMIRGVVDQATSLAIERDIQAEVAESTGINEGDLAMAIERVFRQSVPLNHEDDMTEFGHQIGKEIVARTYGAVTA